MTRDEIVAAIAAAETTAETLRRMLAEMDKTPPPSAAAPITHRSRPVGIAVAERITGMSRTWIYQLARTCPGVGWQLATGAWRFERDALLAAVAPPCAARAMSGINTAPEIPPARETTYLQAENDPKDEFRGSLF